MRNAVASRRDARLIVGSVGLSALGDFLAWIPLMLRLQQHGSPLAVSALLIALWAPIVVLAPVVGRVADGVESRRLLILASFGQAAASIGLALAGNSVGAILVLATVLGCGFAFAQPAEFTLAAAVAGSSTEDRNQMNGWVESARYTGMAIGPVVGGALAAAGGTRIALLANSVSFLVVAGAGLALRARRQPAQRTDTTEPTAAGISLLMADQVLGLVVTAAFGSLLFFTATATGEVFFARDILDAGGAGYGLLMTGWMLGMVAGAVVASPRVRKERLAIGAVVAIALQGVGIALPAAWAVFPFAVISYSFGGVAHGTKNVMVRTLIQERVPDAAHGRAFASYNGLRNGAELVALLGGGVLVSAVGSRATIAIAGGVPLAIAVVAMAIYARLRPAAVGSPA